MGQCTTGELRRSGGLILWDAAPRVAATTAPLGHYVLAHALASMPRQRMRHCMAENGGQAGFILGHRKIPYRPQSPLPGSANAF